MGISGRCTPCSTATGGFLTGASDSTPSVSTKTATCLYRGLRRRRAGVRAQSPSRGWITIAARNPYPSTGTPGRPAVRSPGATPPMPSTTSERGGNPAETTRNPRFLDLGCRNPTDPNQEFVVDSSRILFDAAPPERTTLSVDGHSTWFPNAPRGIVAAPSRFDLEVSADNRTFKVVADKTNNTAANNVEFDGFAPVQCRYVRLTVTGRPANLPMALLEFTVFRGPIAAQWNGKVITVGLRCCHSRYPAVRARAI